MVAVKNPQERGLEQASFGFENEASLWFYNNAKTLGIEWRSGNVKVNNIREHMKAKYSKDIAYCFKIDVLTEYNEIDRVENDQVEGTWFYLSLKEIKTDVPERYWKDIFEWNKGEFYLPDYMVVDMNETKEARNKKTQYVAIKDSKYGGYYLYCRNDILYSKVSSYLLEPEGGQLKPDQEFKRPHPDMEEKEGDIKRKYIVKKTSLRFDTFGEVVLHLNDQYVEPATDWEAMNEEADLRVDLIKQNNGKVYIAAPSPYKVKDPKRTKPIELTIKSIRKVTKPDPAPVRAEIPLPPFEEVSP
ncbi:hypothetical protein ACHHV8_11080 [Paenibacillus sp. TAB 01]|uniref:hypothetical protein n=1 Tax=Paenibacillus sp. TAB 01 TaxID=3368988 RepID=UPI0037523468